MTNVSFYRAYGASIARQGIFYVTSDSEGVRVYPTLGDALYALKVKATARRNWGAE